ncbi:hypothetical protein FIBSPDRAFT_938502, partial [Athelia psychrophila]
MLLRRDFLKVNRIQNLEHSQLAEILQGLMSTRASTSAIATRSPGMQPPVTSVFSIKSLDCQLAEDTGQFSNAGYYAMLYIDEIPVPKIVIYRKRRLHKDALVAQYTGKGRDFLDLDTKYELTDEKGSPMALHLSVNVHLVLQSPDHTLESDEQTFITIGTSGKVTNVGGHFINGDYNVYQEPSDNAIHAGARVKGIQDVQMDEKIEKWMDAPDTSPNFNAARKKHQP